MKTKIFFFTEISKTIGGGHYHRTRRIFYYFKKKDNYKSNYQFQFFLNLNQKQIENILKANNKIIVYFDLKNYPINYAKINKTNFYFFYESTKKFGQNTISIDGLDLTEKKYTGPKWYPYPINFFKAKKRSSKRTTNLLIAQGATDAHNNIKKIIKILENMKLNKKIKIYLTSSVYAEKLNSKKINLKINYLKYTKDVSKIYKKIDLAITACGNMAWELNFFNINCFYLTSEKREIKRAKILEQKKFGIYCNPSNKKKVISKLSQFFKDTKYKNRIKYFKHNGIKNIFNLIKKNEPK
jgi:spore coat polysaccharide biosynthesis predicted glycosyltransferase SpsG